MPFLEEQLVDWYPVVSAEVERLSNPVYEAKRSPEHWRNARAKWLNQRSHLDAVIQLIDSGFDSVDELVDYYSVNFGFNPLTDVKWFNGFRGYEAEFDSDDELFDGLKLVAKVYEDGSGVHNRILLRFNDSERSINCVHTAVYSGTFQELDQLSESRAVELSRSTEGRPVSLPLEEHFVALKMYTQGMIELGLHKVMNNQVKLWDGTTTALGFNYPLVNQLKNAYFSLIDGFFQNTKNGFSEKFLSLYFDNHINDVFYDEVFYDKLFSLMAFFGQTFSEEGLSVIMKGFNESGFQRRAFGRFELKGDFLIFDETRSYIRNPLEAVNSYLSFRDYINGLSPEEAEQVNSLSLRGSSIYLFDLSGLLNGLPNLKSIKLKLDGSKQVISDFHINKFPDWLAKLFVEQMDLSYNDLIDFPGWVKDSNLKSLNLTGNRLHIIPEWVNDTQLNELNLKRNPTEYLVLRKKKGLKIYFDEDYIAPGRFDRELFFVSLLGYSVSAGLGAFTKSLLNQPPSVFFPGLLPAFVGVMSLMLGIGSLYLTYESFSDLIEAKRYHRLIN